MAPEAPADRRPSRVWYAVPVVILVAALALAISLIARESDQVERRIRGFDRASAPGQARLTFDEPGEYLLYVEGPVTPNSYIDPTEIILLPAEPGSRRTVLERFQSFVTYTDPSGIGGHAEFTFTVPEAGDYHLKVRWTPEDINGIAVGAYVYENADGPVRQAFAVAVGGAFVALLVTAAIAVVRHRRGKVTA